MLSVVRLRVVGFCDCQIACARYATCILCLCVLMLVSV